MFGNCLGCPEYPLWIGCIYLWPLLSLVLAHNNSVKMFFCGSAPVVHGSLSAQFFFTIRKCHMRSPNDKRSVEIFHHSSGHISRNTYRHHLWRKGMVLCGILRAHERGVSRCFGSKARPGNVIYVEQADPHGTITGENGSSRSK